MSWGFLVVETDKTHPLVVTSEESLFPPSHTTKAKPIKTVLFLMDLFIWQWLFVNTEERGLCTRIYSSLLKGLFIWECLGALALSWAFCIYRERIQSYMILGLVDTLSPALDTKFQEARRELIQKLRRLKERPPLVRRQGDIVSILG